MDSKGTAIIILSAIFIGVFVFHLIYRSVSEKRRAKALRKLSAPLGLNFSTTDSFNLRSHYFYHTLFRLGDSTFSVSDENSKCVYNVRHGKYGKHDLYCFDYRVSVTSGWGSRSYSHYVYSSGVLIDLGVNLKNLLIYPKNLLDTIASFAGISHAKFGSADFNRRFHVQSKDAKFAHDVLHPAMMEFLCSLKPRYSIELCIHSILLYKSGTPKDVRPMLEATAGFIKLLPDDLLVQLKTN